MGNSNSSAQQPTNARLPPSSGASEIASPRSKGRKKSIELSDVNSSLNFTSSPTTIARAEARRRSSANEYPVEDTSGEDDLEVGEGTLRGAMQGKAEHVVYGPRRADGIAPSATTGHKDGNPHFLRPATIALPAHSRGDSTLLDPDDTSHPGFKASPRLTSDVLLSSDRMPVVVSPLAEELPVESPFATISPKAQQDTNTVSLSTAVAGIVASTVLPPDYPRRLQAHQLLPPHTSSPFPPALAPGSTIQAPSVPSNVFANAIPSGSSVTSVNIDGRIAPNTVFIPPNLLKAPIAAIPIPLLAVPSATIAAGLLAAAVDLGAGAEGVPTLIKWKDEDGQLEATAEKPASGPKQVFVTGTFAKGWKTKIELRKTDATDFSALISLPPGPHRLKFIVDKEWKASKHLPVATDADGNLINYLQVDGTATKAAASLINTNWTSTNPSAVPPIWNGLEEEDDGDGEAEEEEWTQEIPTELLEWSDWELQREAVEVANEAAAAESTNPVLQPLPPPPFSSGIPPPSLPAQLEKGPLNHAAYVTQGSGDDNSILPKPDHSVINHLAASPIKGGFLSVGVTTRYKRKFVTIVYYKALATPPR